VPLAMQPREIGSPTCLPMLKPMRYTMIHRIIRICFGKIDPYRAQRAEHDSYATCEDSKEFVYQHGTSRTRTRLDHSQRTISTASSKEDLPIISTSISVSLFSLSRPVPRFFSTAKICLNLCTRDQAQLLSNLTTTLLHPSGDTKSSETGKVNTHQNSLKMFERY